MTQCQRLASGAVTTCLLGILLTSTSLEAQSCFDSNHEIVSTATPGHRVGLVGDREDFPSFGYKTWFYCIESQGSDPLDFAVFLEPECGLTEVGYWSNAADLGSIQTSNLTPLTTNLAWGTDGSTGLTGVRHDSAFGSSEAVRQYYITSEMAANESSNYSVGLGWSSSSEIVGISGPDPLCTFSIELPVELISLEVVVDGQQALIEWTTASETDNAGFEIQHAVEEGDFRNLAFIKGAGTTLAEHHYTHRLENISPGVNRFRLKQIDFDGAAQYSDVVEVVAQMPESFQLSDVYPNPFSASARIELTVAREQNVRVTVVDMLGRTVKVVTSGSIQANRTHRLPVDAADLPGGTYYLHVLGETFARTRSLVVLK